MSAIIVPARERRAVRRSVRSRCLAHAMKGLRHLGQRVLDVSPYGMLIACDSGVQLGEEVLVSFRTPGTERWFDAEGEIARVVGGWRDGDPGYCIGLRFTYMEEGTDEALRASLRGLPPPIPQRRIRTDYARAIRLISRTL